MKVGPIVMSAMLLCQCGTKMNERTKPGEGQETNKQNYGLRLKSRAQLGYSLFETFGANRNIDQSNADKDQERDVLLRYKGNFGDADTLRFGEVFADSPSVSYLLALTVLGDVTAKNCAQALDQNETDATLCKCDDEHSADAMLTRAFKHHYTDDDEKQNLQGSLVEKCETDYPGAIRSLVASVSFAARD